MELVLDQQQIDLLDRRAAEIISKIEILGNELELVVQKFCISCGGACTGCSGTCHGSGCSGTHES